MNKDKANKLMDLYGHPAIINPKTKTSITFARQSPTDIIEIEKMTSKELVKEWKSLVWLNHIYGQISLNELQRIDLIELEMDERKDINNEALRLWFEKEEIKQNKKEEEDNEQKRS